MELAAGLGPGSVTVAHSLVPLTMVSLLGCSFEHFPLAVALVMLKESHIDITVCIAFETPSFAHIIFPFSLVNALYLVSFDLLLAIRGLLKFLTKIDPNSKSLFLTIRVIDLANVDSCCKVI